MAFAVGGALLAAVHRVPLTAEMLLFDCLVVLTATSRRGEFCWAWTPWLAAVVALDDLRGLQAIGPPPHAADVAAAERWLFASHLPVVDLQHLWATPSGLGVHDVVLGAIYLLHTPAPLLCGAALWRWRRPWFSPYVASLLLVATAGWLTYLGFPESPPWLAAEEHVIPPVRRLVSELIGNVGPLARIYGGADPLPNAAMPSLHVAYPCLVAYWTLRAVGRRALLVVAYPAALSVGVVYLGEHWVLDVVAGVAYAALAVAVVRVSSRRVLPRRWGG